MLRSNFHNYSTLLLLCTLLANGGKTFGQFSRPIQHDFTIHTGLFHPKDISSYKIKTAICTAHTTHTNEERFHQEDFFFEAQYDTLSRIQTHKTIWQEAYSYTQYTYSGQTSRAAGVEKLKRDGTDSIYDTISEHVSYYSHGQKYKTQSVYYSLNARNSNYPITVTDTFFKTENSPWVSSIQIWNIGATHTKADTLNIQYRYDTLGNLVEYIKEPLGAIPSLLRCTLGSMTLVKEHIAVESNFCDFKTRTSTQERPAYFKFSTIAPDQTTKVEQTEHEVRVYQYLKNSLILPQTIRVITNSTVTVYTFSYTFY